MGFVPFVLSVPETVDPLDAAGLLSTTGVPNKISRIYLLFQIYFLSIFLRLPNENY